MLITTHEESAQEYLSQARLIDKNIDSKIEQVQSLRALAEKATTTLTGAPKSGTRNIHRMEDIISKMVDLENEINADIDKLVVLKSDINSAIKGLSKPNCRIVLELRYLSYKTWSDIAATICYSKHYIFQIHREALMKIVLPGDNEIMAS